MSKTYEKWDGSQLPEFTVDQPQFPDETFNIKDYGAVGDGIQLNTKAINDTIEACAAVGGGKVVIPAGIWLTGPICLKSNIHLHVEFGSLVLFTSDYEAYPLIMSSFEGEPVVRCQSPIDGEGLENVAITGPGTFDGLGEHWRPVKKWKMTDLQWEKLISSGGVVDEEKQIWWPTERAKNGAGLLAELRKQGAEHIEDYLPVREFLRPNLVSLRRCKRVLLDGPTFQNSPAWNVHPWLCQHVTIQNVKIRNPWYSQNGDGLDLESCRYATVRDSVFDVGDDAICIKSGKNEAGRALGVPSEDILVERCSVYSGHGGIVIGSEMSGGIRNLRINDCLFSGTDKGIRFKTVRGRGGIVENIYITNINMSAIKKEAIIFQMYYEKDDIDDTIHPVTEETPIFRSIAMENITCSGAESAVVLKGLPEMPLEGLVFKDISIVAEYGIDASDAKDIEFENYSGNSKEGPLVSLRNCAAFRINKFRNHQPVQTFMKVTGQNSRSLICLNSNVDCDQLVEVGEEVENNQVSIK